MISSTIQRKVLCQYLKVNTVYMKNVDVPSFKINGETIQEVDNVKYLGHFLIHYVMTKIFYVNADNYMLGVIRYCGNFTCVALK